MTESLFISCSLWPNFQTKANRCRITTEIQSFQCYNRIVYSEVKKPLFQLLPFGFIDYIMLCNSQNYFHARFVTVCCLSRLVGRPGKAWTSMCIWSNNLSVYQTNCMSTLVQDGRVIHLLYLYKTHFLHVKEIQLVSQFTCGTLMCNRKKEQTMIDCKTRTIAYDLFLVLRYVGTMSIIYLDIILAQQKKYPITI